MKTVEQSLRGRTWRSQAARLVEEARALRREANGPLAEGGQLRFQHRRLKQETDRRRKAASGWVSTRSFVPSLWDSLAWQSAAGKNFEEVLIRVSWRTSAWA